MIAIVLWILVLLGFYLALAEILARRFRLRDDGLESMVLPLPTPGHHIALVHRPARVPRFREPVLLCHGLGANRFNMDFLDDGTGSDRMSLGRYLARAGFDVWVLETRGHGRAAIPRRADWSIEDELAEDVTCALEAVLTRTGAKEVYWVGHSWGGLLQYLFQARGHPLARRVRGLVAVGSPATLRHQPGLRLLARPFLFVVERLRRPVPLAALAKLALPIVSLLALFPRIFYPRLAPLDEGLLRRLFASLAEDISPTIAREVLGWLRVGEIVGPDGGLEHRRFSRISLPLFLIAGSKDLFAPPESVRFLFERAGAADKTFQIMGRNAGASVDYGHGGLLVGRQAPDEVFPLISRWLELRATPFASAPVSLPE